LHHWPPSPRRTRRNWVRLAQLTRVPRPWGLAPPGATGKLALFGADDTTESTELLFRWCDCHGPLSPEAARQSVGPWRSGRLGGPPTGAWLSIRRLRTVVCFIKSKILLKLPQDHLGGKTPAPGFIPESRGHGVHRSCHCDCFKISPQGQSPTPEYGTTAGGGITYGEFPQEAKEPLISVDRFQA
jgi:hypothetical protein